MNFKTKAALNKILEKSNRYKASEFIRNSADALDQSEVLKIMQRQPKGDRVLLEGNILVELPKDLFSTQVPATIANPQKALTWFSVICKTHSEIIIQHIQLRKSLWSNIFDGKWDEAANLINEHAERFGPTLWGIQWLILIAEEKGGDAKSELLKKIQEDSPASAIPLLSTLFSLCVDKTIPEEHYRNAVIEKLKGAPKEILQFIEILLVDDGSETWRTEELLKQSERLALIDRYEFVTKLIIVSLGNNTAEGTKFARTAGKISEITGDPILAYIGNCFTAEAAFLKAESHENMGKAWDAYVTGKYAISFQIAQQLAELNPELLPAHEMVVKSAIYLGKLEMLSGSSPRQLLWHHLRNIFQKNEHSEDSLTYIQRFGSRFKIPNLTASVRALHNIHSSDTLDGKLLKRSAYACGVHAPRNFDYGFDMKQIRNYLNQYNSTYQQSIAAKFFNWASSDVPVLNFDANQIPTLRQIYFRGYYASKTDRTTSAISLLNDFLKSHSNPLSSPLSPFAAEEARRTLVQIYFDSGNVMGMQRIIVDGMIERPQIIRRFCIKKIYQACLDNITAIRNEPEFPIIAHLACDDPHRVCISLKRFLRANGAATPSALIAQIQTTDIKTYALLFLRVCTTEVLDSLEALDSVESVETERLTLLDWVAKSKTSFVRQANTEILRLTQRVQLKDALSRLDGGRVVINVPALREAEQERFSDAFFRYAAQRELSNARTADDFLGALQVQLGALGELVVIPERKDSVIGIFSAAFREIRDTFIASPHFGLEACLSGRIRHGIIIQHIRKPLVEFHLAVNKDPLEQKAIADYWGTHLGLKATDPALSNIVAILAAMTEQIDAIAEEVKNVWIQSRTEQRSGHGIFDYTYTDSRLELIYKHIRLHLDEFNTVDAFLDQIFGVLLDDTRSSLKAVQRRIDSWLRQRLREFTNKTIADLFASSYQGNLVPLRNSMALCQQELERTCDQMVRWFEHANAGFMEDTDFRLIADTAIGMVERLNPETRGRHKLNLVIKKKIRGGYFTAIVHMLFYLLDNAKEHSHVPENEYEVSVTIKDNKGVLLLTVENRLKCPDTAKTAAGSVIAKLEELKNALEPAKVVKEGGTGFAKIITAARYEFKQGDPEFTVDTDGCFLKVCVQFRLKGVFL